MKPIHLLVIVQWQGREIALALSRFASTLVRSLLEEVCSTQGLPPGERWALRFEGRPLAPDQRLSEAIPGIEEQRGVVLYLLPESEMLPRTDHDISLDAAPGGAPAEQGPTGIPEPYRPPVVEDFDTILTGPGAEAEDEYEAESVVALESEPITGVFRAPRAPAPAAPAPPLPAAVPATLPPGAVPRAAAVAAAPAPRTAQRQATVRYFHRMNPERTFPLLVVLSKKMIREVVKKAVAQASSQRFEVATDVPVEIEPVLPGCDCYPPKKCVLAQRDEVSVTFWIVPRVLGKLSQPHVLIRQDGKDLAEVPLEIKVVKQTATVCAGVLSLALPFASTLMQHFRLDFSSQLQENFALYAQVANFLLRSLSPEMLGGILLATTLALYLLRRPRKREVFWDVESVNDE
ncbi:MAG: hypothetical protein HYS12_14080 [Planctomycetes bacterium]|nr:hypothetical protein [Planctomycetota bacterium]